jgi:hypothetical protein
MKKQPSYILVADDDPEDQEMLAEEFRRRNPAVEVKCLADGYQVLDYLRVCSTEDLPGSRAPRSYNPSSRRSGTGISPRSSGARPTIRSISTGR